MIGRNLCDNCTIHRMAKDIRRMERRYRRLRRIEKCLTELHSKVDALFFVPGMPGEKEAQQHFETLTEK